MADTERHATGRALKLIATAVLRLLAAYVLLTILWPAVRTPYAAAFRFTGDLLFSKLGTNATVRFQPASQQQAATSPQLDTQLVMRNIARQATARYPVSSYYLAYVPTIVFVSLALGVPSDWRRRLRALAGGLALVHLYIGGRILVLLLSTFSGGTMLATISIGQIGDSVLSYLAELFAVSLVGSYLPPILIWIVVAFRVGDFAAFNNHQRR
jgi:hypothetical protein